MRILNVEDAFNATQPSSPKYTMTRRTEIVDTEKKKMQTELGPDTAKAVDMVKTDPPKWSMQARGKPEPIRGDWVPGPGEYVMEGTMKRRHPTLPVSGRGWHWGSEPRRSMSTGAIDTPGPDHYKSKEDVKMTKVPSWSLRRRSALTSPAPVKGELWGAGVTTASAMEPRQLYDVTEKVRRGGKAMSRSWTFTARPESTLTTGPVRAPGPGAHDPKHGAAARIKREPSWGFGSAQRFGKELEPRPY